MYQQMGPFAAKLEEMFKKQVFGRRGYLGAVLHCALSVSLFGPRRFYAGVGLGYGEREGGLPNGRRTQLYQQLGPKVSLEKNLLGGGEAWRK